MAFNKAMHLSAEKSWRESARHYQRALGFWDDVDVYHYSLAWALFEAERAESSVADYNYVSPRKHLDIAEELNPYRPQPHFLRARISHLAGTQQGGVSVELDSAITGYQRALELDPLYLDARFRLARILLQQNEIEQGLEVLERGLVWSYANSELKQQYYRLTAEIRRILGDQEGYAELLERSKIVSEALRHRATRDDKAPGLFQ